MKKLTCFKAYDIRGKLGEELNEDIAWRIGRAYGEFLKPKTIVLGGDVRLTSETLKLALAKGLQDAGVDVLDIGMSGTEEIYFATFHLGVDGGIEVTASHNPMDYNGMKLVREGARPISGDTGLRDVQRLAEANDFPPVDETKRGRYQQINLRDAYVDHLFGYINVKNLTPLKLVINSGNGAAGPVVDAIEARFKALGAPVELIKVHNTPDGNFPNGIPGETRIVDDLRAGIFFEERFCQQADNVVTLNKLPFFVKQEATVEIAIKGNAHIRAVFDNRITGVVAAFRQQRVRNTVGEIAVRRVMHFD